MKTTILFLLFILLHIVNLQANIIVKQKDSIVMPDLKNDVFVVLTTDSVWRKGFKDSVKSKYPTKGIFRAECAFVDEMDRDFNELWGRIICHYVLLPCSTRAEYRDIKFKFELKLDSLTQKNQITDKWREVTLPRDFLTKVEIIDMDKEISRIKTSREWYEFYMSLEGKIVWVIDRRTMTDSTVTLVETRICGDISLLKLFDK